MFTPNDRKDLETLGIDSGSVMDTGVRLYSAWAPERVLQAAAAGRLVGPNPADTAALDLVVRIGDRPLEDPEYRALVDLLASDHLVWIGRRITCTANGRDLLARWAKYRPCSATRGEGTTWRDGGAA